MNDGNHQDGQAPPAKVLEKVTELAAHAAGAVEAAGDTIGQRVQDGVTHLREMRQPSASPGDGAEVTGQPIPADLHPVRPKNGKRGQRGVTWVAWRDGQWAPVHRVAGLGWVWSA